MKPGRAVFIVAGFTAADAGITLLCGGPWQAAAVLLLLACAAVPLFWHAPPGPGQDGDLEALLDATREDIPDHVPDEWVKGI